LVFVDEMGSNLALAPLYSSYAPKGERAYYCSLPYLQPGQAHYAYIASMTLLEEMGESMVIEGSTTGAVFEGYVENFLAPTLRKGQIVIMDNLKAHKGERVREMIEAKGCQVIFLPPYSPELNPIEEAFSKIKGILRRAGARTREALVEAISEAISMVTAEDARGFFGHCGYHLVVQYL
jgi:transposase